MRLLLFVSFIMIGCGDSSNSKRPSCFKNDISNSIECECRLVKPECAPKCQTDYQICGAAEDWCYNNPPLSCVGGKQ